MELNPYESPREAIERTDAQPQAGPSLLLATAIGLGVMALSMAVTYGTIFCLAVVITSQ